MDTEREHAFLLADFDHVAASLIKNEELGEQRVTFFMTLCTAVLGGAGFMAARNDFYEVLTYATVVLMVLGIITMLRLNRRNQITDRYKAVLGAMREAGAPVLSEKYRKLFGVDAPSARELKHGGHLVSIGALVLALVAVLAWSIFHAR